MRVLLAIALFGLALVSRGQSFTQTWSTNFGFGTVANTNNPNYATDDAVATDGTFLFVADTERYLIPPTAPFEGKVYVFTNPANWTLSQVLTSTASIDANGFGYSIALSGDWLAVGSTWGRATNGAQGFVEWFQRTNNTWQFRQYIPGFTNWSEWGASMAMDGDWMVAGSLGGNTNGYAYTGSFSFLHLSNGVWSVTQGPAITPDVAGDSWYCGQQVEICGTNAFVFSRRNSSGDGRIYLFELNGDTWIPNGYVQPVSPRTAEGFGISFIRCLEAGPAGIAGNWLLVNAPYRNGLSGTYPASLYIFKHNGTTWEQRHRFDCPEKKIWLMGYNQGSADGDWCAMAVRFGDSQTLFNQGPYAWDGKGYVDLYHRVGDAWEYAQRVAPEDRRPMDMFGGQLCVFSNKLFATSVGRWDPDYWSRYPNQTAGKSVRLYQFDWQTTGQTQSVTQVTASLFQTNQPGLWPEFLVGLRLTGPSGSVVAIEYTMDSADPSGWMVATNLTLQQEVEQWLDATVDAREQPSRFYRIRPGQ